MRWSGKVGAVLAIVVAISALVWRQNNGVLSRIDVPAPEQKSAAQTDITERAELIVANDGGYVLDGKAVSSGALEDEIAKLRDAKPSVVIDVVAKPEAPSASIAAALAAAHVP
ncbi:biopolymer transport protein ExbD [Dokdonella fugitiva]|uniref:Biopolymer transport protein ExbD n=1 Tax=Dokdonella fugitiva TaxID=328517 RepID=A0A839EQ97_9GAMM|nr:biopolymer transporter ExbD [Dokdonella fugitiva]MBA8885905.1 biopolymer transport protein ExbD [Dokdonella fugitiva]